MLQSARLKINYPDPLRVDSADVPRDIGSLITWLDGSAMGYGQGTLAARPTSSPGSPGQQGRVYVATDQTPHQLYYDYGTGWDAIGATPAGSIRGSTVGGVQQEIAQGTIQPEDLNARVQTIPLGGVIEWPWNSANIPAWAVLPYGQLLTQAAYPAMQTFVDAAGRTYGGVAATNFNTPDYRGRVGVGKDDMGGVAASRITLAISGVAGTTLGGVFGAEGITLTTGQLPAHNHAVTGAPSVSDTIGVSDSIGLSSTSLAANTYSGGNVSTGGAFGPAHDAGSVSKTGTVTKTGTVSAGVGTLATSNNGSGSAHQNTQPSIIVNKIMRVL